MLELTETITQFAVSEKSKDNAWGSLVRLTTTVTDPITDLIIAENEYMENFHGSDPEAKTKRGKWKKSKYLPNAYKSAKSIVLRAKKAGIPLLDTNGNPCGKSHVSSMLVEKKSTAVLAPWEAVKKAQELFERDRGYLERTYGQDVREDFDTSIRSLIG